MMPGDDRLTELLVDVIDDLEVPRGDVAAAVLAQIEATPDGDAASDRRRWPRPTRAGGGPVPVWVAVAAAVLVVVSIVAVAPARQAVARWLGIGATRVEVVPDGEPGDPGETETPVGADPLAGDPSAGDPSAGDPASAESLGRPADEDDVAVADPLPALGPPIAVFDDADRGRSYVWAASERWPALGSTEFGVVLSVRPADRIVATKEVASADDVELVRVPTDPPADALWLDATHRLVQLGTGRPVVAERVLLWAVDGVEYRLEVAGDREGAVALAAEVEGGTDLLAVG